MSVLDRENRDKLFEQQNGMSPFTGLPLDRRTQRLEVHHIKDRTNGGRKSLNNLWYLPIYEHLVVHFMRFRDSTLSEAERLRGYDTVMGRLRELSDDEKNRFNNLIEKKTGIKVRFI
jgi:hypothetical protein